MALLTHESLPRLLYLGDVPVESAVAGAALLYRLLETYPADRLRVIVPQLELHRGPRLEGVIYQNLTLPSFVNRLRLTRWTAAVAGGLALTAPWRWRRARRLLDDFAPQAVLTVAAGHSWLTAAELARQLALPLHVIGHDEVKDAVKVPARMQPWLERNFARIWQRAAGRWSVSPAMNEQYAARYGASGSVLYPSRGVNGTVYSSPPDDLGQPTRPLTFAFAGSIASAAFRTALISLAAAIEPLGGRLLIYTSIAPESLRASGFSAANIDCRGFVAPVELVSTLRREATVLFVPMSFAAGDRPNTEISFPSKLTEYTAAGLPLLIWAPSYASATRWERENPGVAEVVTDDDITALAKAAAKLAADPARQVALAKRAIEVGERMFSHRAAVEQFFPASRGHTENAPEHR